MQYALIFYDLQLILLSWREWAELEALPADMIKIVHFKQARSGRAHPSVDTGDLDCGRMLQILEAKGFQGSPSNVHLVLDFLGYDFRSRDVVTVFVCCSLRWFLFGTARMLLVTS